MSRHEYDVEWELDDCLAEPTMITGSNRAHWMQMMETAEKMRLEEKAKSSSANAHRFDPEKLRFDAMKEKVSAEIRKVFTSPDPFGSEVHEWKLSLLGGPEVTGKIVVPFEAVEAGPDVVVMSTFDKLFGSISVQHVEKLTFLAMFEGRALGRFVLDDRIDYLGTLPRVNAWGEVYTERPRLDDPQVYARLQHAAHEYLRKTLRLEVKGLGEYYRPYEPRMLKQKPENSLRTWQQSTVAQAALSRAQVEPYSWRPVNEGALRMETAGVNLSVASGGGAVNMAFASQMQDTAKAGKKISEIGNAGVIVKMHQAGKVIG